MNCKECGSDYGFYVKTYVKGFTTTNYNNDGIVAEEQGSHWDTVKYLEDSKYAYCIECGAYVGKSEKLIKKL